MSFSQQKFGRRQILAGAAIGLVTLPFGNIAHAKAYAVGRRSAAAVGDRQFKNVFSNQVGHKICRYGIRVGRLSCAAFRGLNA